MAGSYCYLQDRKRYQHQFTVYGRRHTVTGKSKEECDAKERKIRTDIDNSINLDSKKITLKTFYGIWLEEHRRAVKEATVYSYEKNWKQLEKKLGNLKIVDINRQRIINYQSTLLKEGKSVTTVNNATRLLSQLLENAVICQDNNI